MADEEKRRLLNDQGEPATDDQVEGIERTVGAGGYYDSFPGSSFIGDIQEAEKDKSTPEIHIYKRRWYILIMYGLFAMTQNGVWNTWGPISTTSIEAFNWDNATIAWMSNWGPIAYILVGLVYPWLLQTKGLRSAVASSALLAAIGTSLRVVTSDPGPATILIHIGQFFNGLAGPIAMGAITHLTADWFPPHERVTATALGSSIAMLGIAITFVVGPMLVGDGTHSNSSTTITTTMSPEAVSSIKPDLTRFLETSSNISANVIHKEREDIMMYMYYQCGWAWLVTIIILIYFPSKPPKPPCVSASTQRDDYWKGLWSLKGKGSFLLVAMIYGVSLGVLGTWQSVLNVNLHPFGVSESTAGWIGCYSTIGACVFATLIGRFADFFTRQIKLFILVLYLLGTTCFVVFALMLIKVIPFNISIIYLTIIGGTCFVDGAVPLMFELACELAYPTSEGAANGLLTYINNIGGLIFLGVFSFPNIGTMWMNWALIGSTFVCVPLIGLLKGRFNRLEIDEAVRDSVQEEVNVE